MEPTMQAEIREAGREAESRVRRKPVDVGDPQHQEQQKKATDPSSSFPEQPLDSPEQLQALADHQGPAGSGNALKIDDKMAIRPPVAGKRGEQDLKGDMVGGVNRHLGHFLSEVGDTEAGRKGTGGVDISNTAGMP